MLEIYLKHPTQMVRVYQAQWCWNSDTCQCHCQVNQKYPAINTSLKSNVLLFGVMEYSYGVKACFMIWALFWLELATEQNCTQPQAWKCEISDHNILYSIKDLVDFYLLINECYIFHYFTPFENIMSSWHSVHILCGMNGEKLYRNSCIITWSCKELFCMNSLVSALQICFLCYYALFTPTVVKHHLFLTHKILLSMYTNITSYAWTWFGSFLEACFLREYPQTLHLCCTNLKISSFFPLSLSHWCNTLCWALFHCLAANPHINLLPPNWWPRPELDSYLVPFELQVQL